MIKNSILITLILTLVLVGCQKVEEVEPEITPTEPAKTTTDISIEPEIFEINSLDRDLTLEELDNLEAELDEINW